MVLKLSLCIQIAVIVIRSLLQPFARQNDRGEYLITQFLLHHIPAQNVLSVNEHYGAYPAPHPASILLDTVP